MGIIWASMPRLPVGNCHLLVERDEDVERSRELAPKASERHTTAVAGTKNKTIAALRVAGLQSCG